MRMWNNILPWGWFALTVANSLFSAASMLSGYVGWGLLSLLSAGACYIALKQSERG